MLWFKLLRVAVHLLEGLLTCALVFPFLGQPARSRRVQAWSRRLLRICGVRVKVVDAGQAAPLSRALVVSNHVSWLDIFVINTIHPSHFVAKSDIRDWPLLGWLCARAGTIFISRGSPRDVRRIFKGLVESLRQGQHVAFFPEGTTAAQGTILPFHANLFEAAIDAGVPVQPLALRYLDRAGRLEPAADYIGDTTFVQSMIAILGAGEMCAELLVLPAMPSEGAHRRELATLAHDAISSAL